MLFRTMLLCDDLIFFLTYLFFFSHQTGAKYGSNKAVSYTHLDVYKRQVLVLLLSLLLLLLLLILLLLFTPAGNSKFILLWSVVVLLFLFPMFTWRRALDRLETWLPLLFIICVQPTCTFGGIWLIRKNEKNRKWKLIWGNLYLFSIQCSIINSYKHADW